MKSHNGGYCLTTGNIQSHTGCTKYRNLISPLRVFKHLFDMYAMLYLMGVEIRFLINISLCNRVENFKVFEPTYITKS